MASYPGFVLLDCLFGIFKDLIIQVFDVGLLHLFIICPFDKSYIPLNITVLLERGQALGVGEPGSFGFHLFSLPSSALDYSSTSSPTHTHPETLLNRYNSTMCDMTMTALASLSSWAFVPDDIYHCVICERFYLTAKQLKRHQLRKRHWG